jgi:uncharacterized protein
MGDNFSRFKIYQESPLYQFLVSIIIVVGVGVTLSIILILAGTLIFGSDLNILNKSDTYLNSNDLSFLKYILVTQDISIFIIPSILIFRLLKPDSVSGLNELARPQLKEAGMMIIIAFCLFPITTFTGELNAGMHLPVWLGGVEKWMTQKEDHANDIINQVIVSSSFGIMILNLLIIAVIPAIGEEFIFRGVLQRIFYNYFKSGHLAVWITAIIFSTLHFQFFGFLPRFLLGLVFGYLFFWSETLWLPVIAHFINNSVPVVMAYAEGMDKFNAPVNTPLLKQIILLPLPTTIILVILFYFRNKSKTTAASPPNI